VHARVRASIPDDCRVHIRETAAERERSAKSVTSRHASRPASLLALNLKRLRLFSDKQPGSFRPVRRRRARAVSGFGQRSQNISEYRDESQRGDSPDREKDNVKVIIISSVSTRGRRAPRRPRDRTRPRRDPTADVSVGRWTLGTVRRDAFSKQSRSDRTYRTQSALAERCCGVGRAHGVARGTARGAGRTAHSRARRSARHSNSLLGIIQPSNDQSRYADRPGYRSAPTVNMHKITSRTSCARARCI
jgi:hypothetical protein